MAVLTGPFHSLVNFKASINIGGGRVFLKKNVWTSDKSWEPGSFLMFSYVFQCFLTFSNVTYSHSQSHSLTLFQSLIESLLTCWTTFVFISMLKTHSHNLSLSHSHSYSLSHSFNLSFNHSQHAEQLLFSCLCSKVTLSFSLFLTLTLFQSLIHSLSTCWTTFVFMSMLKCCSL